MADDDDYTSVLGVRAATLAGQHAKERAAMVDSHAQEQAAVQTTYAATQAPGPLATYTPAKDTPLAVTGGNADAAAATGGNANAASTGAEGSSADGTL